MTEDIITVQVTIQNITDVWRALSVIFKADVENVIIATSTQITVALLNTVRVMPSRRSVHRVRPNKYYASQNMY